MLTHILHAESQLFQFVCGWLFLKRERESFCSFSVPLFSAIWTSMQTLLLCPKAYWGCYGYSSYHWACLTNRKHWEKEFFLSFFAVHVMLHKNPDLLLTEGFFFSFFMWMREWKQKVNLGLYDFQMSCSFPSPSSKFTTLSKWTHSASCWSRGSNASSTILIGWLFKSSLAVQIKHLNNWASWLPLWSQFLFYFLFKDRR